MQQIDYINLAIEEAIKAYQEDEVPIGAVIIKDKQVIAKAHNTKEQNNSVLKHAELIAIQQASEYLHNWRLDGCEMYITLEPCPMCASAIQQSRISTVYYGTKNQTINNSEIIEQIFSNIDRNKAVSTINCDNQNCKNLLKKFFLEKRKDK